MINHMTICHAELIHLDLSITNASALTALLSSDRNDVVDVKILRHY